MFAPVKPEMVKPFGSKVLLTVATFTEVAPELVNTIFPEYVPTMVVAAKRT